MVRFSDLIFHDPEQKDPAQGLNSYSNDFLFKTSLSLYYFLTKINIVSASKSSTPKGGQGISPRTYYGLIFRTYYGLIMWLYRIAYWLA